MKLCLFGGTFDPPHVGHLVIAETIQESERFDKVVFVPASNPPHKEEDISPIDSRLEMLRLALVGNDHFDVSDIEIERGGVSYTVETIKEAKERFGIDAEDLYFLIGSDALIDFHRWKQHESILDECRVIVVQRPGFLTSRIDPNILSRIRFSNIPQIQVSSSQIRRRIRSDLTIRYLVPNPVMKYIQEQGLYSS
ncbi:MAG: nicotinic acid mononucleotide adenylyltransferase [Candidatus Marinimicrobia bacterium]|nr:nicotinic acid mononucleotide adenylyltransferase [Candidatus Neomarinimicrobiota bacterium]|tara:strand:- start:14826 stop:15410 length:585 start_codon:yes stop_codon:yes gene_type:complete